MITTVVSFKITTDSETSITSDVIFPAVKSQVVASIFKNSTGDIKLDNFKIVKNKTIDGGGSITTVRFFWKVFDREQK